MTLPSAPSLPKIIQLYKLDVLPNTKWQLLSHAEMESEVYFMQRHSHWVNIWEFITSKAKARASFDDFQSNEYSLEVSGKYNTIYARYRAVFLSDL